MLTTVRGLLIEAGDAPTVFSVDGDAKAFPDDAIVVGLRDLKLKRKKIQFQIYFWAVVSTIFLNVKVFDEFFFFHYILRIYTYCVGLGSSLMLLKASKAALILA